MPPLRLQKAVARGELTAMKVSNRTYHPAVFCGLPRAFASRLGQALRSLSSVQQLIFLLRRHGASTASRSVSSPPAPSRHAHWSWHRAGQPKSLTPPSKETLHHRPVPVLVPMASLVRYEHVASKKTLLVHGQALSLRRPTRQIWAAPRRRLDRDVLRRIRDPRAGAVPEGRLRCRTGRHPRPAVGLVRQREDGADVCRFERRAHEGARDEQRVSAGYAYADPQRLSRAIDQASPGWNGIRFLSRQHNRRHASAISECSVLPRKATHELTGPEQTTLCVTIDVRLI